uniref:Uncharacterized protein n=1 Tax=Arundo donax TaxID=35708 RepID=A0A0A9E235_ARUDO
MVMRIFTVSVIGIYGCGTFFGGPGQDDSADV